MLEILPDGAQMTDLVGERLYDIWKKLCAAIEEKYDTERNGTTAAKHGRTNINTAAGAKHCARCMHEKTASGLW